MPHRAEQTPTVAEVVPIRSEDSGVEYHCFESPVSVFADSIGLLVVGKTHIETVSGETKVTAKRELSADKVYRHAEHGEHSEYLIALKDGVITLYCGENEGIRLGIENIIDFDAESDTLYALTGSSLFTVRLSADNFDNDQIEEISLGSDRTANTAKSVAVLNGTVYVTVDSAFGRKQDICVVSKNGALSAVMMQTDVILSFCANDTDNTLYALTRDELTCYTVSANGGLIPARSARGTQLSYIYAHDGFVYALDTLNALHKFSDDLSVDKVLLASGSIAKGFFNMPTGAAAKNSTLYIADSMNGRIAVYGKSGIEYLKRSFVNPVSIAADSAGTVYVAYEYSKVGIFRAGDFSEQNETTLTARNIGIIRQLAVDADKTVYILADTGLWRSEKGGVPALIDDTRYKSIALSVGKDRLFALSDDVIVSFDENGKAQKTADAPADAVSIAVDLDGKVFTLTSSGINGADMTLDGEKYTLGGKSGQIILCTVENGFVAHGDAIIVDTYRHRLLKTNARALGARLIDEDYEVPDVVGNDKPQYYGEGLIRTVPNGALVFSLPMETKSVYEIAAGRKVIVPQYELEETKEYSLILVDDINTGKLIQGYVYKDALSEPLPYSAPPSNVCSVYNAATPVYKYPSRNSVMVRGYAAVDRNTEFTMLDFVASYRDEYGNLWYRLQLDGTNEGYVFAENVSTMSYEPIFIRPAYNAEIISYKNSKHAIGYKLENGKYSEIAKLPTGTKVEVIGAFDSSEQYTKVKFLDGERGTMTCYVKTVYIEYDGVNMVLIVAIVVIVITVMLATIIIGKIMLNKRKQLEPDEQANDR